MGLPMVGGVHTTCSQLLSGLKHCAGSSAHPTSPRPASIPPARRGAGRQWPSQVSARGRSPAPAQPGGGGICTVSVSVLAGGWLCAGHAGGWVLVHTHVSAGPRQCVPVSFSRSVCLCPSHPSVCRLSSSGSPSLFAYVSSFGCTPIPYPGPSLGPRLCEPGRGRGGGCGLDPTSQEPSLPSGGASFGGLGRPAWQQGWGAGQGREPGPPVLGLAHSLQY